MYVNLRSLLCSPYHVCMDLDYVRKPGHDDNPFVLLMLEVKQEAESATKIGGTTELLSLLSSSVKELRKELSLAG